MKPLQFQRRAFPSWSIKAGVWLLMRPPAPVDTATCLVAVPTGPKMLPCVMLTVVLVIRYRHSGRRNERCPEERWSSLPEVGSERKRARQRPCRCMLQAMVSKS